LKSFLLAIYMSWIKLCFLCVLRVLSVPSIVWRTVMFFFVILSHENRTEFLKRVGRSSIRRVLGASARLEGPTIRSWLALSCQILTSNKLTLFNRWFRHYIVHKLLLKWTLTYMLIFRATDDIHRAFTSMPLRNEKSVPVTMSTWLWTYLFLMFRDDCTIA
jgi:hypothetical protein